ncbi:MAG: hypothetical protein U9R51_10610 [Actinomycetota bacterium]|nr:hypothetical protein [Actinomycetota bacterium]
MDGPEIIARAIAGFVLAVLGLVLILPDQHPADGATAGAGVDSPESVGVVDSQDSVPSGD